MMKRNDGPFAYQPRRPGRPLLAHPLMIWLAAFVIACVILVIADKALGQAAFDAVNFEHWKG